MAVVLGDLAAMRWTLGRGEAARDTLAQALELLPEDEPSRERAKLLVDQVRFFMLQGRYSQTREAAQAALAAIDAAGADELYAPVLNRLGIALICDGEPELGTKTLRDALELARRSGVQDAMAVTYANLADGLHAIGRSSEALEVALEGLAELDGSAAADRADGSPRRRARSPSTWATGSRRRSASSARLPPPGSTASTP